VTGYRSYDYLHGDLGLPLNPLAPEFDRVPAWVSGCTQAEIDRAKRLLVNNITISLHDHPVRFPADMSHTPAYNRSGRQHTAFSGLAESGLTVVFDNMMDGTATVTGNTPWQWDDIVIDLGMRQADLAHQAGVSVVRTIADIHAAHASRTVGLVFGLEAATPIGNDLDRLDVLFGLGLRQIGIAYSDSNALGAGLTEPDDFGLTTFGRRAVRRMNQLGLAIDVSHSSQRTAIDTAAASEVPVFLTHTGARAVWDIPRMSGDDALRAVADTGGVVGMSAAPHTTVSREHPRHNIDSVMDHFLYCIDLIGIDHVAFGPDTLYGDHVGLHTTFATLLSGVTTHSDSHERVAFVDGLENPTENFHNISAWLVRGGFSDEDIIKVLGGNVLRALGHVWP
jgi:membrane dipeptidase